MNPQQFSGFMGVLACVYFQLSWDGSDSPCSFQKKLKVDVISYKRWTSFKTHLNLVKVLLSVFLSLFARKQHRCSGLNILYDFCFSLT